MRNAFTTAFDELKIETSDRAHAAKKAFVYLASEGGVSQESSHRVGWTAENVKDGNYQADVPADYLVGTAGCVLGATENGTPVVQTIFSYFLIPCFFGRPGEMAGTPKDIDAHAPISTSALSRAVLTSSRPCGRSSSWSSLR